MQGADSTTVKAALADGTPLSDTRGFAGALEDGRVVRDVLGRYPAFTEADDPTTWSDSPRDLSNPDPVPAGHVRSVAGTERAWELPDPPEFRKRVTAVRSVRTAIDATLEDVDDADLAVAFSGGIDSATVASRLDAPLYVAGFPGSHDIEAARSAAAMMDRDLHVVELSPSLVEDAVPAVASAIDRTNAMDVQIALPLYLAAERASADGYDKLAVGQGADELFGGYAKVARAPTDHRVEADTVRGAASELLQTLPDQLERDVLALRDAGVEPVAPLLDDRVVEAALRLPGEMLVDSRGERKWALRLAAREFVPDRIAFREKKAAQYGSLAARELDRLARQNGFKRRMDDHVGQYVRSLVEN